MFYIIDLQQDPPTRIPSIEFETHDECIDWINENGSIVTHSIEEQ
jgi:hypothetical protein